MAALLACGLTGAASKAQDGVGEALDDPPRVVVHYRSGSAAGARAALDVAQALNDSRVGEAEVQPVYIDFAGGDVRYFFAGDRDEAQEVLRVLAWVLPEAEAWPLRDFAFYRPLPQPGTIEVWMPGR